MISRADVRASVLLLGLGLATAGCDAGRNEQAQTWRADCPPIDRPAPLSLEAARAAHRAAAERHELRLREAAAPGFF